MNDVVKPRVTFTKFGKYEQWGEHRTAILYGIKDHPRLGRQNVVHTSGIVEVDNEENPSVIHTRNTIYVRE